MRREDIYDNNIAPRMAEIIRICKENDIPFVASFQLDDERPAENAFLCTTSIVPKDGASALLEAFARIYPGPHMSKITVQRADGSKEVLLLSVIS